MNEEIYLGLKNALDRGEDLETAASSYMNAGYNPTEVREAQDALSTPAVRFNTPSSSEKPQDNKKVEINEPPKPESKPLQQNNPSQNIIVQKSSGSKDTWIIVLLSFLLLLVLGGAGALYYFRDKLFGG